MHKTLVWERTRHVQRLRHALRESYPAFLETDHRPGQRGAEACPPPGRARPGSPDPGSPAFPHLGRPHANMDESRGAPQRSRRGSHEGVLAAAFTLRDDIGRSGLVPIPVVIQKI